MQNKNKSENTIICKNIFKNDESKIGEEYTKLWIELISQLEQSQMVSISPMLK